MPCNGKWLACAVALAVALTAGSPSAAQVEKAADADQKAADLAKQLEVLTQTVHKLANTVESLKLKLDTLPAETAKVRQDAERANLKLDEELAALRRKVDQLQRDVEGSKPGTTVKAFAAPSTGKIRIINTYPGQKTVMVNGRTYRLQPGETQLLDEPVGRFTYEVFGYHEQPQTRELDAVREFTITVYPILR